MHTQLYAYLLFLSRAALFSTFSQPSLPACVGAAYIPGKGLGKSNEAASEAPDGSEPRAAAGRDATVRALEECCALAAATAPHASHAYLLHILHPYS